VTKSDVCLGADGHLSLSLSFLPLCRSQTHTLCGRWMSCFDAVSSGGGACRTRDKLGQEHLSVHGELRRHRAHRSWSDVLLDQVPPPAFSRFGILSIRLTHSISCKSIEFKIRLGYLRGSFVVSNKPPSLNQAERSRVLVFPGLVTIKPTLPATVKREVRERRICHSRPDKGLF
jgi:hypothetical protein